MNSLDIDKIRNDFPILQQKVYNKPLVYMDNGATTQKPSVVIEKINEIHTITNSSIHRGVHYLSGRMTGEYESARETVRKFINAGSTNEIVFTSGATGSLNLLAFSLGEKYVREGDEIVITEMEHHSNIVPWQLMCERKKASLKVVPFDEQGELMINELKSLLNERTRLLSLAHVSNTLGTVNPVKEIINLAHDRGIPVCLDGAQAIQHGMVDVRDLDADFYVFSGHKVFGPTGTGVLFGKEKYLEEMPPYQGGGDMVDSVSFERTTFNVLPFKFEAGTANYPGAIGMAAALDYLEQTGLDKIAAYEKYLLEYSTGKLEEIEGLKIYGKSGNKIPVQSFLVENIHPYDMGMILDKIGIAVRTGTHCAQPVMDHFHIAGTVRASMVFYNTAEEIDLLVDGIRKAVMMLK